MFLSNQKATNISNSMRFPLSHVLRSATLVSLWTFFVSYLLIQYNGHVSAFLFPISMLGIKNPEAISYKIGCTLIALHIIVVTIASKSILQTWIRRIMTPQFALLCFVTFTTGIVAAIGIVLQAVFPLQKSFLFLFTDDFRNYPVPEFDLSTRIHFFGMVMCLGSAVLNPILSSFLLGKVKNQHHFQSQYPVTYLSVTLKRMIALVGAIFILVSGVIHPGIGISILRPLAALLQWFGVLVLLLIFYSYWTDFDDWKIYVDITSARITLNNSSGTISTFHLSVYSIPILGKIWKTRRLVNQLRGVQLG